MNPEQGSSYQITLKRSQKRKTVAIQIYPDRRVVVSVPIRVSDQKVQEFLAAKHGWILKTLQKFSALGPVRAARKFVNGELYSHLGVEKKLNLLRVGNKKPEMDDQHLHVFLPAHTAPDREADRIKASLEKWYQAEAYVICGARVAHYSHLMKLAPKSIQIKNYRTRWGTCKSTGEVSFNWRLAMAPLSLLDYVVVHELAHLKHHHHGPKFWKLVREFYPSPEKAKKELQALDYRGELRF